MALGNPQAAVSHLRRSLKAMKTGDRHCRQAVELSLAEVLLDSGSARAAAKSFARLAEEAGEPDARGRALLGLVRAESERGRAAEAELAMQRVRQEFPDLVAGLPDGDDLLVTAP